jgi:putative membrane protein
MSEQYIPYCGPAPTPTALWTAWNLDPFLISVLILVAFAVHLLAEAGRARRMGHLGVAVLVIAFVSPICALSTALFSARIVHHLLLIAVAAPLLAAAFPARRCASGFMVSAAFLTHTVLVWFWHAPSVYQFALSGHVAYWLMELTLLASALWMWRSILGNRGNAGSAIAALVGSMVQMGLLGALLTFARHPLFAPHFATTELFGLSAMADQQLAGLIMWVPAALPYLVVALAIIAARLRDWTPDTRGGRA